MRRPSLNLILSLAAVLYVAALLAFLHLPYRLHHGRTRFAPGYSEFVFQTLRPGMEAREIAERLGPALAVTHYPRLDAHGYAPADWFGSPRTLDSPPPTRRFAPMMLVFFDETGRVSHTFGVGHGFTPPAVGTPKKEIVFIQGCMPVMKIQRPPLAVHDYALPDGSPVYKIRRIYYNPDGTVNDTEACTVFGPVRPLLPNSQRR